MHAATLKNDLVPALFWAVVGTKLGKDRVTVVPIFDHVARLLLLVQRDTEGDRLVCIVGEGSLADQVGRTFKYGLHRLRSKVTSQVFVVVEEVFTPDLDYGTAVLRAVPWVDRMDSSVIIVTERLTICRVSEVTGQ